MAACSNGKEQSLSKDRVSEKFVFVKHAVPEGVSVPEGMVYVPGGRTRIGAAGGGFVTEQPAFYTDIKPFFMDISPVTVAQFAQFVKETDYITQAEKFGNAGVFDVKTKQWKLIPGADWKHPMGVSRNNANPAHPVTQISWYDAEAYCQWAGKRLPTEIEWEHAARNAQNGGPKYAWGDELVVAGKYMANTWQGNFPDTNTVKDGYVYTAPVGVFGKTLLGLTDMGGNVWEWCADWYKDYNDTSEAVKINEKVQRGGSFLCDPKICHGFRVSARGSSSPETALSHIGFRCVKYVRDP